MTAASGEPARRCRGRDLGIAPGELATGPLNAITDVAGVRVGHATVIDGSSVRTGVTAVLPHGGNLFAEKVRAALAVGNAFGKLIGATQLTELGELETPLLLTGTLSSFRVADALVGYILGLPGNESVQSVNPVVGETNDGYLSDGRLRPINEEHVRVAVDGGSTGTVTEGCVGAGTGTICFGWKGGIGTASRIVETANGRPTVGVLVQTNFGGSLRIVGVPVGNDLRPPPREEAGDGSCMIVVATDAPLDARQLERLGRRAVFALSRVGSGYSHGSGDYAIAFSTWLVSDNARVPDRTLTPLFAGALEATEEAVLNSLFAATTTAGRDGRRAEAIPIDRVVDLCLRHGIAAHMPSGPT